MTPKYRAAVSDDLIWHDLDSMTLLFHRTSGITHMLADPAPAILEAMEGMSLTAAEIAARLSEKFDIEAEIEAEDIVLARLQELAELGLVTRVAG